MGKHAPLLAVVALIAGAAVWVLLRSAGRDASVSDGRPTTGAVGPAVAPAPLEAAAAAADAAADGAVGAARVGVAADEVAAAASVEPPPEWVVRVRDRGGRPIPDLDCLLRAQQVGDRGGGQVLELRSNERGELRVPPSIWSLVAQPDQRVTVEPLALLTTPVALRLEGAAPPRDGGELWLPELGLVDVRLLDPDGRAFNANLGGHGPDDVWVRNASVERPPLRAGPNIAYANSTGSALYVQTRLELEGLYVLSNPEAEATGRARGPQLPFERVELPIRVGSRMPIVRMRVLDAQGPYAERELLVGRRRNAPGSSSSSGGRARPTDRAGILLVPLQPADATTRTLLTLADAEPPTLQAIVALPELPSDGWVDIGDVRLEAPALLVAGVVTDAAGAPIAGASVSVNGRLRPEFAVAPPPKMHAHFAKFRFLGGPSWSCASDAHGRFELRAQPLCAELELRATADGHPRSDPLVCAAGTADARIVLAVGGGLEGRVLLAPDLQPQDLRLTLETESVAGVGDSQDQVHPALAADGAWGASGLRPGHWKIRVHDARVFAWEPLVPALDALVSAGSTTRVPDIDLAGGTRTLSIEVVDTAGLPVAAAQGTFHGQGSHQNNDIDVRDGRATLLTQHAVVEAWLGGPGYLCEHVPELRDGARIVLKAAPRIELALRDLAALPPEPYLLCVQLDPGLGADNWVLGEISRSSSAAFDRAGRAVVELRHIGKQRVQASVRSGSLESNARMEWLNPASEGPLELGNTVAGAPIELAVDPAEVQAVIQKLSAPR